MYMRTIMLMKSRGEQGRYQVILVTGQRLAIQMVIEKAIQTTKLLLKGVAVCIKLNTGLELLMLAIIPLAGHQRFRSILGSLVKLAIEYSVMSMNYLKIIQI